MEHSGSLMPKLANRFADLIRADHLRGFSEAGEVRYIGMTLSPFGDANVIAVTDGCLLGFRSAPIARLKQRFALSRDDLLKFEVDRGDGSIQIHQSDGKVWRVRGLEFDDVEMLQRHVARMLNPDGGNGSPQATAMQVYGLPVDRALQKAMFDLATEGESPWLVIHSGVPFSSEALVAFDDRLAIIKKGAGTASLGGRRSSIFYFSEINGIDYHTAGRVNKLRVLAAGSRDSSSAPEMELAKVDYEMAKVAIAELHRRIATSGQQTASQPPAQRGPEPADIASQLNQLAALHTSGALSDDEFSAAKQRLLNS